MFVIVLLHPALKEHSVHNIKLRLMYVCAYNILKTKLWLHQLCEFLYYPSIVVYSVCIRPGPYKAKVTMKISDEKILFVNLGYPIL